MLYSICDDLLVVDGAQLELVGSGPVVDGAQLGLVGSGFVVARIALVVAGSALVVERIEPLRAIVKRANQIYDFDA